jgi:hypothetical protein
LWFSEVQSTDVRTEQAQAQIEQARAQDEEEEESAGTDLIREFDANLHVIVDPRCPS